MARCRRAPRYGGIFWRRISDVLTTWRSLSGYLNVGSAARRGETKKNHGDYSEVSANAFAARRANDAIRCDPVSASDERKGTIIELFCLINWIE